MDASIIRIADHPRFHRTALSMAAAGGLAGLAAHVAGLLEPRLGGLASPLPLAVVMGAIVWAAAPREERARRLDWPLVLLGSAIAAAALSAGRRGDMSWPWSAALFAAATGLLAARGLRGPRLWLAAASGAAGALLARAVLMSMLVAAPGPAWLVAALAGVGCAAALVLGSLPRHLQLARAPVRAPADAAEILVRARAASGEPGVRELLDQLAALDRDAGASPEPPVLEGRMAELGRRADATADALARAEYEKARDAVIDQLHDVRSIRHGRERVLARLHRALEEINRARLAATSAEADATTEALLEADG